jgi:hypothetical protein
MLALMTAQFDSIQFPFRIRKDYGWLVALSLGALLPGCSMMPPLHAASTPAPTPSIQTLRLAEQKAYAAGFTAGKKAQASHDQAVEAAREAEAAPKVQPPAQVVQTIPLPAAPAPEPVIPPAATSVQAQNSYNSSGPARPLRNAPGF